MRVVEYVWIGGNEELRSKTRVLDIDENKDVLLDDIPEWNYDGSSTEQAEGHDSEIVIKPRRIFTCPFRDKNLDILVMCDTYYPNGDPHETNTRFYADKSFNEKLDSKPWFGLEQEYFMLNPQSLAPLQFDEKKQSPQGRYYCSVGHGNTIGRHVAEEHLDACLTAGIKISGINAEVAPAQWEFQIGPCEGIESGDHLWIARYILNRVAEKFGVVISYHPKPIKGNWNGSGCHANYSTVEMREGTGKGIEEGTKEIDGLDYINKALTKLSKKHDEHMNVYGSGNELRMTGEHETSSYDVFTYDIANRGCSVRIPNSTAKAKKGYFEDRRPSSNMDPYLVTSKLFETTVLN
jgi:glutamine synthetase